MKKFYIYPPYLKLIFATRFIPQELTLTRCLAKSHQEASSCMYLQDDGFQRFSPLSKI
jgi:hypothetical protein